MAKHVSEVHYNEQLDEIELLHSMFSQPGEFDYDEESFSAAQLFINNESSRHPSILSCTIHLKIEPGREEEEEEEEDEKEDNYIINLDVICRLPNSYPTILPEVYVRSDDLSRQDQDKLNENLQRHMNTNLTIGDVCILPIIEWIKENTFEYYTPPLVKQISEQEDTEEGDDSSFCRMWLYMHHIYSKIKRRNILSIAKDLELTGFCLPGKPGVVCIEGTLHNTKQFYNILRRWNWKSITCREKEIKENIDDISNERKIVGFQELGFDTHGPRANHLDLGQFRSYLRDRQLDYMFKKLFGVD